ncbi:MAG TPA: aldo/keto reductase [Candidatus Baltobacteraceae bacterium]|nr:aldo/keto reductase [Candidatus Baltobacteraceae bacterium]
MEFTQVRNTDIRASRIGLGTWAIGGWMWGGPDDDAAVATIQRALDAGITLVDTAPAYGQGHSEEVVGRALKGRRDRTVIATKVGLVWDEHGNVHRNASAARINEEIDGSLRRLQTDYIDIYQVHWPDPSTPMEETAKAMQALHDAGKIRAIGVSNFSPAQMDEFSRYATLHTLQPPYNLFEREAEKDALPYGVAHELTALTYGALCRGLLSGKMRTGTAFSGDDLRRTDPKFQPPRYEQYLRAVARLDELAQARFGKRVIHLALRWVLDQPGVGAALWGARRPDQVDPISGVFDFSLDAGTKAEIDRILAEEITDPVGPEFMAPPQAVTAS